MGFTKTLAASRQHPMLIGSGILLAAMLAAGGAFALRPHHLAAEAIVLPPPIQISDKWQGVDRFIRQKDGDERPSEQDIEQGAVKAKNLAAIRAQLNLPSLPMPVARIVTARPARTTVAAAAAPAPSVITESAKRQADRNSLVSNHAQETLDTLEAFKAAMKAVNGPDLTVQGYRE